MFFVFFQAEDGIRDIGVTGVQTCALPICDRDGPRWWRTALRTAGARGSGRMRYAGAAFATLPQPARDAFWTRAGELVIDRSEERRVGKECRSRWSPYH